MEFKTDWDEHKARERLLANLRGELIDRYCIVAMAKIDAGKPWDLDGIGRMPGEFIIQDLSEEYLAPRADALLDNVYYAGDALPILWPNFGVSGQCKYFKGVRYGWLSDTLWYEPLLTGEKPDPDLLTFEPEGRLQQEAEALRFLVQRAGEDYFVAPPDHGGVLDSLSLLWGNAALMVDLMRHPEEVMACCAKITECLLRSNDVIFDILKEHNGGGVQGWMNALSEGRIQHMQADCSVMFSPRMYREFVLPELLAVGEQLDDSLYHFDGQEQIRHLDLILSVPKIRQIQWTHVAGQPPVSDFIEVFQRIQKAGKGLILAPEPEEMELLMRSLSSRGLKLIFRNLDSPKEADRLVEQAARWTRE